MLFASAQTNEMVFTNQPTATNTQIKDASAFAREVERVRMDCIQSRRRVCGKIVKVLPEGLVVDSGYTNLMREPLNRSWLIPGTAEATKPAHVIEENRPGSVCIGLVFLADPPSGPGPKAKVYDYVNIEVFPIAPHTYVSVGELKRTVRGFSVKLAKSVEWKLQENRKENTPMK
jgi:hypothetical protein